MNKHRFGPLLLLCSGALLASSASLAGLQTGRTVFINDTVRFASGDIGWVHNSTNRTESIGCYSDESIGVCIATNASGLTQQCWTANAELRAIIRAVGPDSGVEFSWDTNGVCSTVTVDNSSSNAPVR